MPYLERIAHIDPRLFVGHARARPASTAARELLPTVDVPTLIVAGARDGFTPRALSARWHAAIPGAELLVIEDGSHTAPIERPDLVCRTCTASSSERHRGLTTRTRAGDAAAR